MTPIHADKYQRELNNSDARFDVVRYSIALFGKKRDRAFRTVVGRDMKSLLK
ncbi:MAG TPA: hypothetical protein VLA84_09225 [Microcoleus sp.]|nr:hypothetical protein [Microcoleus sp.]